MRDSTGGHHPRARDKQKARLLQEEVAYLLASTDPGGRVLDDDLLKVFRDWNPDIEVSSNLFSRAVKAVTGLTKHRSDGKGYWEGFHLPTAAEIAARAA
jgi:hypothetical protein